MSRDLEMTTGRKSTRSYSATVAIHEAIEDVAKQDYGDNISEAFRELILMGLEARRNASGKA